MKNSFGPILFAGGNVSGEALYSCLIHAPKCPTVDIDSNFLKNTPELVSCYQGQEFWSCDFAIPQEGASRTIEYSVNGEKFSFCVSALENQDGFRIAYASCSGSELDEPGLPTFPGRNALWQHMGEQHDVQPFHVLIQGGDQIYADSLWRNIPFLAQWKKLKRRSQYETLMPEEIIQQVRDYYFACYLHQWSQPDVRHVMARIPSLMIWDDHDIFDGWGSWNKRYQASPVYQGIFRAAKEAFELFQRGGKKPEDYFQSWMVRYGDIGIIAPDLRSERTRKIVMGEAGWAWFERALEQLKGCKDVVMVSSVPLATAHFSALDPILTGFPSVLARALPYKLNPKRFADDIHDQWRVPAHRDEWVRMLKTLLDFSQHQKARITVLSGEIHLGARSKICRDKTEITQYIASGIAHKPAHPAIVLACEWLSKGTQDLPDGIDVRMEYFFPKGRKRYLAARNWLALSLDFDGSRNATWHAENMPYIHHKS